MCNSIISKWNNGYTLTRKYFIAKKNGSYHLTMQSCHKSQLLKKKKKAVSAKHNEGCPDPFSSSRLCTSVDFFFLLLFRRFAFTERLPPPIFVLILTILLRLTVQIIYLIKCFLRMHIQTCFILFSKVARLSNYKYD